MKLERTKNTLRGVATGMLNKIVTLFLPFLVRTVLIQKIGMEYAGLNSLFTSILHILNLTELGFSNAVVHSMYKPIAEDDEETICALLHYYRRIYFVIGIVIFSAGLLIMPFLTRLIGGSYPSDVNLYLLYLIYLVNTSISYLLFGYKNSILNAFQQMDVINNISTLTNAGLNIVQVLVLITTKNYYGFVLVMPVFTLLNNLLTAYEAKRRFPQYVCRGSISAKIRQDMRKKVSGLMIQKVCATTRNTLDSIFISAFMGLALTAVYSNYYYIMNAVTILMGILTASMQGGVGNGVASESKEANFANMCRFEFMYLWIGGWFTAALLCLYQPFMRLWMGEENMLGFQTVMLLCAYFYGLKIGDIRTLYYQAAGLWWEGKWRALLESALNLLLNFLLGKMLGVNGIVLATLLSLITINFFYGGRFVFRYYFGMEKIRDYYLLHGQYLGVTVLCCVVTYVGCQLFTEICSIKNELACFLIKGLFCMLIPNAFLLLVYGRTKRFQETVCWLRKKSQVIFGRKKGC